MVFFPIYLKEMGYIRHPVFRNLFVIPYVRGRLVFAELVARAILEGDFELVVLDLPYFMKDRGWIDFSIKLFPFVSSLVIKKGNSFITFPFAPNDAACISAFLIQDLKEKGHSIDIECIDDSNLIHYPSECLMPTKIKIKDDYFVFVDGLKTYFSPLMKQLDSLWKRASDGQRFFVKYRANIVAERLKNCLRQGKKALFVCDYRLWWSVSRELIVREPLESSHFVANWSDVEAVFVLEDPYLFWERGILDDFPAIVFDFYKKAKNGRLDLFDKLKGIKEIIKKSMEATKDTSASIRKLVAFSRYLINRVGISCTFTPDPVKHIYDAAYSCIGKQFAKEIARNMLNYPLPDIEKVLGHFLINQDTIVVIPGEGSPIPDLSERCFFHTGTKSYSLDNPFYSHYEDRVKLVQATHPYLTKREISELKKEFGTSWAVEKDYRLHEAACSYARQLAKMKLHQVIPKRSLGSIKNGIHWKATIASKAMGEDAIYVKYNRLNRQKQPYKLNEFTPVVFIFSKDDLSSHNLHLVYDSNITQRNIDLGNKDFPFEKYPPPDFVYSVLYTYSGREYLCYGHIAKNNLSSIAFLYTLHHMGIKRHTAITGRPEKFQCRIEPYLDPELNEFSLGELGLAWAIKYAEKAVLLIAKDGWRPSRKIFQFARVKKVQLIQLPLSKFHYDFVRRLQTIHFTSTGLKKHPRRDAILERFVE